ncbi:peptidoglycan editing factor PgeF [Acinetobacter sp. SwsAc6]|uniref:peptidoglycan editing factor PgeF n=1 Tax=Acinetobacter TaxID=469 RepID=UPI000EA1A73D|nr:MULTISPECIES: peptidoglycan editing factor PgeF [Acinetobacter]NWK73881.1 peptidoglycan editing factor PgeF [Acinetobacter sp. SwsAc6]RKG46276.1 peptidoglycan editing factor PgeF [Acinetobacter cumulans]RZG61702.1 peptidoglycan editing factor PgeF [Acinetobacter sp. WCHAc060006]
MQFVEGLPKGIYVGQTRVHHAQTLATSNEALSGFNLALHVQDDAQRVQRHRMALLNDFATYGVNKVTWMTQTHSTMCHTINEQIPFEALEGDGLVTQRQDHALMMMTADCLPVVLGNAMGTEVANLHAGWRGLAGGIIENTIAEMQTAPTWAWLGAAISQACFEIGAEVKHAFCSKYPALEDAFKTGEKDDKYYADLYAIARYILAQHGVQTILGGDQCSYSQADEYFSYRRHAETGRMATFVFMA